MYYQYLLVYIFATNMYYFIYLQVKIALNNKLKYQKLDIIVCCMHEKKKAPGNNDKHKGV